MNNYPDDIRSYDDDPRSPFYEEPLSDEEAENRRDAEEYAADMEYDRLRDERESSDEEAQADYERHADAYGDNL